MGTYMTGPIQTGTGLDATGRDTGTVVLSQTAVINADGTLVQNAAFTLPANAQIVEIYADTSVLFNSGTTAVLTVGTASGGTQYVTSVNVRTGATGGRNTTAHNATQVAAMGNIGNNTALVATVTSTGTAPTVGNGQVRVTIQYVQN